jgi:hypothetical protein
VANLHLRPHANPLFEVLRALMDLLPWVPTHLLHFTVSCIFFAKANLELFLGAGT